VTGAALSHDPAGILRQLLGLREKVQGFGDLWVGFSTNL
jgi:hypothetical protein